MNILLLGKTGLLGSEFLEILKGKSREITDLEFFAPNRANFDVLNFEQVDDILSDNHFDLIIYCVAYTSVDQAEKSKSECYALNVEALDNILRYEIPIIHFSTDYVFRAEKDDEITENFPRNPLNYYGQTKLEAEKLLENSNDLPLLAGEGGGEVDKNYAKKWWNIRTSWLFGKGGKNFISTILKKAKTEKTLEIVNDEIGRPTYAKDLAEFVVAEFVEQKKPSGHYHLQNTGKPVSWANLARFLKNLSPDLNLDMLTSKSRLVFPEIKEITADKLNRPAKRPLNSVLKNTKLKTKMRDWKAAVRDFLS